MVPPRQGPEIGHLGASARVVVARGWRRRKRGVGPVGREFQLPHEGALEIAVAVTLPAVGYWARNVRPTLLTSV